MALLTIMPPTVNSPIIKNKRHTLFIACLSVGLLLLIIISLFVYSFWLSPFDIFQGDENAWHIMWHSRIPRMMAAVITGMAMSLAGLIMQALTNNSFVSPTTAGTLEGTRLGVLITLLMVPFASIWISGVIVFSVTLLTTIIFIIILAKIKIKNQVFVPIIGIIYGGIIAAIAMFLAQRTDNVQRITIALLGDFNLTLSGQWEVLLLTIPLVVVTYIYANRFMIAGLGEDVSKSLGLNYRLTTFVGLVLVSLISTLVLLVAGIIPFLGLIIPNIVRLYLGDNIKKTILPTMLVGAIFVLLCDIISRLLIFPLETPISLATGVLGAIIFLMLLLKNKRYQVEIL